MMAWLTKLAEGARDDLLTQVARFKNREFMEAVVAGCAMVAAADGTIAPAEKQKMIRFIQMSDELKVFPLEDVISSFNKAVDKFQFDFDIGQMEALKITGRLASNHEAARLMVRLCCLVGASDGNFDADEKKAVVGICTSVGLAPSEFDLA